MLVFCMAYDISLGLGGSKASFKVIECKNNLPGSY
jgi:hypothetical protein